jgi:azurin
MKTFSTLIVGVFSLFLIVGCGGKEEKKKEGFSYEKTTTEEKANEAESTDDNVANVVLSGNDLMKFDKDEIIVKAGQKVKLTLRHIGKLDINIMGHNVVILKSGVNPAEFAAKAATEKDNAYIPNDSQDIIANTELIGGGQVTSIEFDAPEAGTYEFLCSFPGHFAMMRGKFIVE